LFNFTYVLRPSTIAGMWTANITASWLAGFTVCLSLIISIGAQNLYVLKQAVRGQHVRACVAWCVVSDALLIGLGVAGMAQLLSSQPDVARWLGWGGVLFLLGYGSFALWRMWMAPDASVIADSTQVAPRGLLGVLSALAVITLFNPHVYLDTVVLVGSIGARQEGHLKWMFVLGAACASLVWFGLLSFAAQRMRGIFAKPMAWRVLDGLTGVMMLALACWVWQGLPEAI
jgi:L-lysine exporter family protein LysE/ArgO